jgi:hypothetical protein
MTAATFPRSLADQALTAMTKPLRQACAVRLVDRRTGLTHRVNGSPLVLFTKNPAEAVAELLAGRDACVWEARIEPIGGAA